MLSGVKTANMPSKTQKAVLGKPTFSVFCLAAFRLSARSYNVSAKVPCALRVWCRSSAVKGRALTTSSIFRMTTSNEMMWGPMQRLSMVCSCRNVPHFTNSSGALHFNNTQILFLLGPTRTDFQQEVHDYVSMIFTFLQSPCKV